MSAITTFSALTENSLTSFETYLLTARRSSPNTVSAYIHDIRQCIEFLRDSCGVQELTEATSEHLHRFIQALAAQAGARSRARKISALKHFFSYTSRHSSGTIKDVATELVAPQIEKRLPRYLSEGEIELLFATAAQDSTPKGIRNAVMLHTLYATGVRITELITLKDEAIRAAEGFISVTGKGKKQRDIPVPYPVLTLITYYREQIRPQLTQEVTGDFLFGMPRKGSLEPISRQSFWMILKKLVLEAGIRKDISPHSLRHSLATHMLNRGAHLRSLQMLLGHEKISTVTIYTHLETDGVRRLYDKKHPRG